MKANRPEPIVGDIDILPFTLQENPQIAVDTILSGEFVLVEDFFSTGLLVLNQLKKQLNKQHSEQTFSAQRDFRNKYHKYSQQLLLHINNNTLVAKKSPKIGWLTKLYPDVSEFLLPFPQVQGLNSAWQWYKKGIKISVLKEKIHPYFGCYFPTRFEHILLFEQWLLKYQGQKKSAIDVGVGSGVLSFQLLKHGFATIFASDSNPNAIIGLKNKNTNLHLFYGDLFAGISEKTELIVFNPPWLPETYGAAGLDKAIYYEATLFSRFFEEAKKRLKKEGKIVLLFSNLAEITGVTKKHPIRQELENENRFKKELFLQKKVEQASKQSKRNQNWRPAEQVELWVLSNQKKNTQNFYSFKNNP